jgi:hypothetical protein
MWLSIAEIEGQAMLSWKAPCNFIFRVGDFLKKISCHIQIFSLKIRLLKKKKNLKKGLT